MEEQILRIIIGNIGISDSGPSPQITGLNDASATIAETFERFNNWCIESRIMPDWEEDNQYLLVAHSGNLIFKSHTDLFTYWNTHINK